MFGKRKTDNRRRYIRIKTVFPVLFQVISEDKRQILSKKYQGFTRDISASGICLTVHSPDKELIEILKNNKKCKISLIIDMPFFIKPIEAVGGVVWIDEPEREELDICLLGIEYEEILLEHQQKIIKKVKLMRDIPKITAGALVILLMIITAMTINELRLRRKTQDLVLQLNVKSQEMLALRGHVAESHKTKAELDTELDKATKKIALLNERIKELEDGPNDEVEVLKKERDELILAKNKLEQSIAKISGRDLLFERQLEEIKKSKEVLESRVFDIMYQYLKISRDKNTGLIPSFKGDPQLGDSAFTYDQALSALLFTINKDYKEAEKILDFYLRRAGRTSNVFYNGYFASDGSVSEYVTHIGPNIFIGLAAIQFAESTGRRTYLPLAEDISEWLMQLQFENKTGAIRGGSTAEWISTEQNLGAYSLFKQLYRVTGRDKYREAADKVFNWINKSAYNRGIHAFNRGESDASVATDANVLAILSLGPEKMYENRMDPEKVLEFIERRCRAQVEYRRPDGRVVLVEGFDFTDPQIARREPAISSEWTAQAVVAYKIIADYFEDRDPGKSIDYKSKAEYYLAQLQNIAIVKGGIIEQRGIGLPLIVMALPYASEEAVDTGHGWRTPGGQETTSLAGTIYTIFAHRGYNYFELILK
jgi:hypothetical protein